MPRSSRPRPSKRLWYLTALIPDHQHHAVAQLLSDIGAGNVEWKPYREPIAMTQSEWFAANLHQPMDSTDLRRLWESQGMSRTTFYSALAREMKAGTVRRTPTGYAPSKRKTKKAKR